MYLFFAILRVVILTIFNWQTKKYNQLSACILLIDKTREEEEEKI